MNFDIVIDSHDDSIDMKTGLETFKGVSDATRIIVESILSDNVVKRQSYKSNVRTNLKQTFKGSYGLMYNLEIYDTSLKDKFNQIGQKTFAEIMTYFINESLFLESENLSSQAERIIEKFGDNNSEDLIQQLRASPLNNIHKTPTVFEHNVKINFRKSQKTSTQIAKFDSNTAESLRATIADEGYDITASITRFNIFTGNGRLLVKNTSQTVAFGFKKKYGDINIDAKRKFSTNLNENNGLPQNKWKYLKINVLPIQLQDGKIIKYIVTRLCSE